MRVDRAAGASLLILLVIGAACRSYEARVVEGEVVDEDGSPLEGVSVTLCYVGWKWDWSMAGGFPLTWDHLYCSQTATTDQTGRYRISYPGPPSMMVYARHEDWVQTRNFSTEDPRVVLVRRDVDRQRRARREEEREKAFRRRRPDESVAAYYCRVVRSRADTVELDYHGQRIRVTAALLVGSDRAIFAVSGPYETARALAGEVVIGETGLDGVEPALDRFAVLPEGSGCRDEIHLITSVAPEGDDLSAFGDRDETQLEVPSLRLIFALRIWTPE